MTKQACTVMDWALLEKIFINPGNGTGTWGGSHETWCLFPELAGQGLIPRVGCFLSIAGFKMSWWIGDFLESLWFLKDTGGLIVQEEILSKPNYSRREIITPCSQITNPCACMYASLRIHRCTCFRGGLEVLTLYVHVAVDNNISVHISILSVNVCLWICVYKNHLSVPLGDMQLYHLYSWVSRGERVHLQLVPGGSRKSKLPTYLLVSQTRY